MSALTELGSYLTTTSANVPTPFGVLGTSFFLGLLPDNSTALPVPDNAISLEAQAGAAPVETFAPGFIYEVPHIRVVVRNTTFAGAEAISYQIFNALNLVVNATLSGHLYYRISAIQSPHLAERDDRRRSLFYTNYTVLRALP